MTVKDLEKVKLSQVTRGYLGIGVRLSDIYEMADKFTSMEFGDDRADDINKNLYTALEKAKSEIMMLAARSILERLRNVNNHTEI